MEILTDYDFTWEEIVDICKIDVEISIDIPSQIGKGKILNRKLNHNFNYQFSLEAFNYYIQLKILVGNNMNIEKMIIGQYIRESKLENIFGKIKI